MSDSRPFLDARSDVPALILSLLIGLLVVVPAYVLGAMIGLDRDRLVLGLFPVMVAVMATVGLALARSKHPRAPHRSEGRSRWWLMSYPSDIELRADTVRRWIPGRDHEADDATARRYEPPATMPPDLVESVEHSRYSIVIQWSPDDQAYVVSLPEWGERVYASAPTYDDALQAAKQALGLLIASAREGDAPLPKPHVVRQHS